MKRPLFFLSILALSGCGVSPSDDNVGSPGGKADGLGAPCVDDASSYPDWFDGYMDALRDDVGFPLSESGLADALELAANRPCASDDAAYLAWWKMYGFLLDQDVAEMKEKAEDFRQLPNPSAADYDSYAASLSLDAERLRLFDALLAAAPEGSERRGYAAWALSYDSAFSSFSAALAKIRGGIVVEVFEKPRVFITAEDQLLALFEDGRPKRATDGAYGVWLELFTEHLGKVADPESINGEIVHFNDAEQSWLARHIAVAPAGWSDSDGATWMSPFTTIVVDAAGPGAFSTRRFEMIEMYESFKPQSPGGEVTFRVWIAAFASVLQTAVAADATISENHRALLDHLIGVMPCQAGADNQEIVFRLVDAKDRLGVTAAEYIDAVAAPNACPEPKSAGGFTKSF
jgi:hypothetical protein